MIAVQGDMKGISCKRDKQFFILEKQ